MWTHTLLMLYEHTPRLCYVDTHTPLTLYGHTVLGITCWICSQPSLDLAQQDTVEVFGWVRMMKGIDMIINVV